MSFVLKFCTSHTYLDNHVLKVCVKRLSLNVFIANMKQGVGTQVFPTLVTALPLIEEAMPKHLYHNRERERGREREREITTKKVIKRLS